MPLYQRGLECRWDQTVGVPVPAGDVHGALQFRLPDAQESTVRALGELRYEREGADGTHAVTGSST